MNKFRMTVAVAALASAFATGAALAADLPSRSVAPAAPVFAPPAFTWTGFYVGANAGYGFGGGGEAKTNGTQGFSNLVPPGIAPGALKVDGEGFIGGGQIGYNYQINRFVLGLEADLQYVDNKKSSGFIGAPILGTQLNTSAESELRYLGTLRARLGYTPLDRLMIYATGGLAYGDVKSTGNVTGVQNAALVWNGSKSDIKFGYTVGAGAEYALTNNWTLKTEYLYYDLGNSNVAALGNGAVRGVAALNGVDYLSRVETKGHIVRAGVNYKF
ncbi:MAG: outer membrane protein [Bosea sp. (in: a-proteobacteria)]